MIVGLFLCTRFLPPQNVKKIKIFAFLLSKRAKSSWSKQMCNGEQIRWECLQAHFWQPGLMVPEVTLQPLPESEQLPCRLTANANSLVCRTEDLRCGCVCVSSRGAFLLMCALMGCREHNGYWQSLSTHVSNWRCVETWKPALPGEVGGCLQLRDWTS